MVCLFLGGEGRYRTNVWDYAGVTSVGADQNQALSWHPTVKPVAMVRDAIVDCSHRGDIVLDNFGGSGTTLIGAHKAGRSARLIEFEPRYCDVAIRRFQALTGKLATLDGDGRKFEQVAAARASRGPACLNAQTKRTIPLTMMLGTPNRRKLFGSRRVCLETRPVVNLNRRERLMALAY